MSTRRIVVLAGTFSVLMIGVLVAAATPGRITIEGDPGVKLRFRATTDSNVSLVSAAAVYARNDGSVDVLAPATFAIKLGAPWYVRFDAADSTQVIRMSAEGGLRFGFASLGSVYKGVSVVCGSLRGSTVHPLLPGETLTHRRCPA